jgi:hypothetical protein
MAPQSGPGCWEGLTVDTHHPTTRSPRAALLLGLLSFGISAATAAQAGNQLFEASWTVKSQGNECSIAASGASPGPYCGNGAPESSVYGAFGMPQGIQCNPNAPRCPFESTPTDGARNFAPLGGSWLMALYCAPWADWRGYGTTARPAKGETRVNTGTYGKIPPLYRNPGFFTSGGQPKTTFCTSTSRSPLGGKGLVQAGNPIVGTWGATTTTGGAFNFGAAGNSGEGIRTTGQLGEFAALYPYVYSYTYATLRNNKGVFGPGNGPGSFSLDRKNDRIHVKQGAAKFGGTMTMLGSLTTKVCYYRNGGCSLGSQDWRYDAIGTSALTSNGVVTNGYVVTWLPYCYCPATLGNCCSTPSVEGSRFSWTTGSVTVTATGRGPHNTVHYAHGYDNRNTTTPSGLGTIQLVSPTITRWRRPAVNFETAGIGILRIKFVPEPQTWLMLVVGVSLLGLGTRMRGR